MSPTKKLCIPLQRTQRRIITVGFSDIRPLAIIALHTNVAVVGNVFTITNRFTRATQVDIIEPRPINLKGILQRGPWRPGTYVIAGKLKVTGTGMGILKAGGFIDPQIKI